MITSGPRRISAARIPAMLVLLLATCLLASGCGDTTAKDYEVGLAKLQTQLDDANTASRESGEVVDQAKRRAKLEQAQQSIDAAAATAESLTPPKDARAPHKRLATALREYATLFGKLATLEPGSPDESELYTEAGRIVKELDDANRALEKAGYSTAKS